MSTPYVSAGKAADKNALANKILHEVYGLCEFAERIAVILELVKCEFERAPASRRHAIIKQQPSPA